MRASRIALIAASSAIFAVATAVSAYLGYLFMFTRFTNTDDEGFMLVALRSFISGHPLYDQIVVQYGPFYFEFFGVLGALGVTFDTDNGRLITLAIWVAIALLAGIAVFVFTRNLALGLTTHLITFAIGESFISEPMHPAGLVTLLVIGIAAVALLSAGRWSGPGPFFAMGALAAAALLTKVNVGGFAAISIAFACVLTFPSLARRWPLRLGAAMGFVVVPFLLMRSVLDQDWVQRYAFHVGFSALALVVATTASRPDPNRRISQLGWLLAGGGAVAALVLAVALFRGSSPNDLLNGLILYPLNQRQVVPTALTLPPTALAWDLLSLGGACLWTLYRLLARRPEVAIEGAIRVLVGVFIWLEVLGLVPSPGFVEANVAFNGQLILPVALAWLVAAPRGRHDGFDTPDFARTLLPALAILQSLHAFLGGGTQAKYAALTLVPVAAISIADGLAQLGLTRVRLQLAPALVFLPLVAGWLPAAWQQTSAAYSSNVPLDLAGASRVRLPADQAAVLRQVTRSIRDNCDTFISVPGLDSFYIFGQFEPPTPLPTRFMWLTDDVAHQQALIRASQRINRLCVVENDSLMDNWTHGRQITGPLAAYIQADFVATYSYEHYSILIRR